MSLYDRKNFGLFSNSRYARRERNEDSRDLVRAGAGLLLLGAGLTVVKAATD